MKPFRTRVKICGMTNLDDALMAAQLGVDAIGLIFHAPSPRNIDFKTARKIALSLPPFVACVGVVVNQSFDWMSTLLEEVPLDIIQFHGQEEADFCRVFGKPYIKAIHMSHSKCSLNYDALYPDALGFLFDTLKEGLAGGSGETFNWNLLPKVNKPLILAGGLTSLNIKEAITVTKPYAVDVTTGVEKEAGRKDFGKMKNFISTVINCSKIA